VLHLAGQSPSSIVVGPRIVHRRRSIVVGPRQVTEVKCFRQGGPGPNSIMARFLPPKNGPCETALPHNLCSRSEETPGLHNAILRLENRPIEPPGDLKSTQLHLAKSILVVRPERPRCPWSDQKGHDVNAGSPTTMPQLTQTRRNLPRIVCGLWALSNSRVVLGWAQRPPQDVQTPPTQTW
jgi:hypothetical protein